MSVIDQTAAMIIKGQYNPQEISDLLSTKKLSTVIKNCDALIGMGLIRGSEIFLTLKVPEHLRSGIFENFYRPFSFEAHCIPSAELGHTEALGYVVP